MPRTISVETYKDLVESEGVTDAIERDVNTPDAKLNKLCDEAWDAYENYLEKAQLIYVYLEQVEV